MQLIQRISLLIILSFSTSTDPKTIVKSRFLFGLFLVFLFSVPAFSQNTFPSSGNVGIGTTNPGSSNLYILGGNGGVPILTLDRPGIGKIRFNAAGHHTRMEIFSTNIQRFAFGYDATKGGLAITKDFNFTTHDHPFFVSDAGNIGIGTTSTASKLTVAGDMRFTSEYQNLYFATGGAANGGISGNSGYNPSLTMFHNGGIEFQSGSPTTDHTKMRMYINGQGNVGINTRFPDQKLTVNGNIKLNTEWQDLIFAGNNGVSGGMRGNSGHYTSLTMYHGHSLEFQTGANGIDHNNVRMHINNQGNVGIGTRTPGEKLTVDGNIKLNTEWQHLIFEGNGTSHGGLRGNSGFNTALTMFHGSALEFQTGFNGIDPNNVRLYISTGGNIGIGTRSPTQKLSVAGKINAEEIILEDVVGADFVFEEDYDLRSLAETEQFIKANKHLPEIPSAAEMAEEGLEIKVMNIRLLQKIEELTLHMIRQEKEMQAMQAQMLKQQSKIEALEQAQNN